MLALRGYGRLSAYRSIKGCSVHNSSALQMALALAFWLRDSGAGGSKMRIVGIVALSAALVGCAASRQEVATRLGDQYVGQNVDALVIKFGPPASTFKMNSGDTSYIWQLGNQTNINTDRGSGIASTQFCKVSVIAAKMGVVSQLNTEDSNAGGGLGGALGMYGSICANRLGMERQS
jgi:hypothetical protein